MSTFAVPVVRLGKVGKHPNADALSITTIEGCPCIFRMGDMKPGDIAVYIPVDAVIDGKQEWARRCLSFLKFKADGTHRVKAMKLRGIFSMGILLPAKDVFPSDELEPYAPGTLVHDILGITKFEEVLPAHMNGRMDRDPGLMPVYEVENWRKYKHVYAADDEVVVTEKIHGTNSRFIFDGERLHIGTHRTWRVLEGTSAWHQVVNQLHLTETLQRVPNLGVFGEVYGWVQDLKYGAQIGEVRFAVFDMFDAKTMRFLDWDAVVETAGQLGLPVVPVLYRGPATPEVIEPLAVGKTTMGGDHIREGVVIKTVKEAWHPEIGRMITKLVSEDYLLRKDGTEYH